MHGYGDLCRWRSTPLPEQATWASQTAKHTANSALNLFKRPKLPLKLAPFWQVEH
ncbi:hypothetical protein PCASD_11501 [Puccinia coronata f. sp. avenae]|uniref:Uncharacterized protein n=1 Tax=Puccinia coronata f. sp. avenae TaxID=200324 RepID=A0A2N5V3D4_9BASI|nr:hypothetical protein PCASD_11501 [Puccinia coronata f. sp. avenae]